MSLNPDQIKSLLTSSNNATFAMIYSNKNHQEHEKSVTSIINNLLKSEKTRLTGLELLQKFVNYCSPETFSENSLTWSSYCVPHPSDLNKQIKLNLLTVILQQTIQNDSSFHKKFQSEFLPSLLKSCLVFKNDDEKIACFDCLTQCMKRYPAWFGNHWQKMEKIITETLDTSNLSLVKSSSLCFLYFLQTGSSGENGINYTNNFTNYYNKLCHTIQNLYNDFFYDSMESDNQDDAINFAESKSEDLIPIRILNCVTYLKMLIMKQFSFEKRIILKYVIDVINRGLSRHFCCSFDEVSLEIVNRSTSLKKIQLELIKLFQILTKVYSHNLLPFGFVLKKTLINILKNATKCQCYEYETIFMSNIYETLNIWLELSGNLNQVHLQEILLPIILKNITPVKKTTLLNQNQKKNVTYSRDSKMKILVVEQNCICALETLEILLKTFSFSSNQKLFQELVSLIVKIICDIQMNRIVSPYNNQLCQLKLYEVLVSVFKNEELLNSPSIHSVLNIFNKGLTSPVWAMKQVCREGLDLLEKISHPVCPTLNIHVNEQSQLINERQTVANALLQMAEEVIENRESLQLPISEKQESITVETESSRLALSQEEKEVGEDLKIEVVVEEKSSQLVLDEEKDVDTEMVVDDTTQQEDHALDSEISEEFKKDFPMDVNEENTGEDMFGSFQDVVQ